MRVPYTKEADMDPLKMKRKPSLFRARLVLLFLITILFVLTLFWAAASLETASKMRFSLPGSVQFAFLATLLTQDISAAPPATSALTSLFDDGNAILNKDLDPQIFTRLGQYAPRYSVKHDATHVPLGCRVEVVNSLERHGARYMTANALASAQTTINKVQNALKQRNSTSPALPSELAFLQTFSLQNGTADLVPYGALQAYYSGRSTAAVYPSLAHNGKQPFVRSTGDEDTLDDRVILTAKYWTLGFSGAEFPSTLLNDSADVRRVSASLEEPQVIFSEKSNVNNTLDVSTCPADNARPDTDGEKGAQQAFAKSTILPTVGRRLQERFAEAGVTKINLTATDMINFASICSFDTLGRATVQAGRLSVRQSDVCAMFNATEWETLGYAFDVGKWQGAGYGNPLYKALGQGFLRELVARFTNEAPPLEEPTSLNATVDGKSTTFPLPQDKGPRVFFDGSHDNNIAPIVAAASLFDGPLLQTSFDAQLNPRSWTFSQIAPLQGKVVFEKLRCISPPSPLGKEFVRIRANGAILNPQSFCNSKSDNATSGQKSLLQNGLCPLEEFVKQLNFVESAQEWNKCYS